MDDRTEKIVQALCDRYFECAEKKSALWDTALEAMMMLDTEHFEAIRKAASCQGEQLAIKSVLYMITNPETIDPHLERK